LGTKRNLNNFNLRLSDQTSEANFESKKKIPLSLVHNMPAISMKWSPNSPEFLFFAYANGYIGFVDIENSSQRTLIVEENDELACIDFNNNGSCLVSVGKDPTVRIYDTNTSSPSLISPLISYGSESNGDELNQDRSSLSHSCRLQSIKFSNVSNEIFYTGGWDRTIKMWDKRTRKGLANTIHGPFICGSDAIDVNVKDPKRRTFIYIVIHVFL
jgi:WD40 repeat protein